MFNNTTLSVCNWWRND